MHNVIACLENQEYNFLRENSDLKHVIYLTLSGSYGYGTNIENSDIDLRGVLIEDNRYLLGLKAFEQFEDIPTDTVIYSLKKFVSLCVSANPNALELLGTDEDCIVMMKPAGRKLRENVDLFFSKQAINSFGNYATAQLRRLSNALCHDQYSPCEQEEHLQNSLNAQIDHFNRTYTFFDKEAIRLYIDGNRPEKQLLFDISLKGYPVRDFVNIYSEMHNTIKTYNKLNHRNRKKDEGHLYKHAMHLIRLLITGIDILDGKGVITKRKDEHQFLMDLRSGKYSFTEVFNIADEYQQKFAMAAKRTQLPDRPDLRKVEDLMLELYEEEKK